MLNAKTIIITNCTHRKRSRGGVVCAQDIFSESKTHHSINDAANLWYQATLNAQDKSLMEDTYRGRSFSEAKWSADFLRADLYVVSAGLGLLQPKSAIPNYNLTVSGGPGSIQTMLEHYAVGPSAWWTALTTAKGSLNPIQRLAKNNSISRIFLALPAAYIQLIKQDLEGITKDQVHKLRILTSPLGSQSVPSNLIECTLPYDERLEGILPGTRTDFPQRALRHFITTFSTDLPSHEAQTGVAETMDSAKRPSIPLRVRRTDAEIITLLCSEWNRFNGSSSRLLRFLRDEAFVACEQSRFRDLWREAATIKT